MGDYGVFDLSIFQIKVFLLLAEERNFSRVAAMVSMTQPTLSKRISQMEQALGMQLFIRSDRPIRLTPAAERLYEGWKPLVEQYTAALTDAESVSRSAGGCFVIGMADSGSGIRELPRIVDELAALHPKLEIITKYLSMSVWKQKLFDGELDAMITAVFETDGLDDRFGYRQVDYSPLQAIVLQSNPLAGRETLCMEDLRGQHFVVLSSAEAPAYYRMIKTVCKEYGGFEPAVVRHAENAHNLVLSLQKNNEVVIGDKYLRGIDDPRVRAFPLHDTNSGTAVIWLKSSRKKYVSDLIRVLGETTIQAGNNSFP